MPLRDSLRARSPDPALIEQLETLCSEVLQRISNGRECVDLLAQIETSSGCHYGRDYFVELWGREDSRDFAERAALGPAKYVPDLTHDELLDLVGLIREQTEPAADYYLDLFERNVTHPAASDLIFWPSNYWPKGYEPTCEEIVEKATASGNVIRL